MLALADILVMRAPLRMAAMATIAAILFAHPSQQQTYSTCNPTTQTCPGDTALGRAVNVDFTSGTSSEFTAQMNPTYDSNGASFTIAKSGDAPQLNSNWYIMFGHVEVTMKAAPGAGIVSSSVLQSDDLDEIDWEWLGAQNGEVQSNYFGRGQTTTYDRAAVHSVDDTQGTFHTYTIDWTENRIVWQIDGNTVRVLNAGDANGMYPQTPMQFKLGAWSGGDSGNPEGTISWAQGPTDYTQGPFTMVVQSCSVIDYSTGSKYTYGDQSGSWTSIMSDGGAVNANSGAASGTDTNAPAITSSSSGNSQPFEGTHRSDSPETTPSVYPWIPNQTTLTSAVVTNTDYPGLPSGWTVSGSGKVIPPSAAPSTSPPASSSSLQAVSAAAYCSGSGYKVVTSYNNQGFLTTATVAAGVSTGWDNRGFPTTLYPPSCPTSNYPMKAGEVLRESTTQEQPVLITSSGHIYIPTTAAASLRTDTADSAAAPGQSQGRADWLVVCWTAGAVLMGVLSFLA